MAYRRLPKNLVKRRLVHEIDKMKEEYGGENIYLEPLENQLCNFMADNFGFKRSTMMNYLRELRKEGFLTYRYLRS